MARRDMSWRDATWNKFLDDLSIKHFEENRNGEEKWEFGTSSARLKVETSIKLRISHLMDDAMRIKKSSNKFWVETSYIMDSGSISDTVFDSTYDLPKIRQVFWSFIENSIKNEPHYTDNYNKIFDFFVELIQDFNSDKARERTEFIDSFYFSLFDSHIILDEFHIYIDRDCNYNAFHEGEIIPPRIKDRVDEIENLKKEKDIQYLYWLFQNCIISYNLHRNVRFERVNFFENVTDVEKRLFELLYVKFPRNMEDARGKFYGKFDVLKAMENNEWEKFDIKLREEIIECLEEMCQGEKPIYKYLAPDGYNNTLNLLNVTSQDAVAEKVKNIKFKLAWPVYYRLKQDVDYLSEVIIADCHIYDDVWGANAMEDFQKDLHRLIERRFGNNKKKKKKKRTAYRLS